jgi:hypothetical protein
MELPLNWLIDRKMLPALAATDNDNLDKADHCPQTWLMDIMDA